MHILSIGNSFSQDATRYLSQIAKADNFNLNVVNLYIGGCSLDTHAANILTGTAAYDFYTNTGTSWSSVKRSIADGIAYADWAYPTKVSPTSLRPKFLLSGILTKA